MKYKIGFLGTGVMASAFIERMVKSNMFPSTDITAIDLSPERLEWLKMNNINIAKSTQEIVDSAEIVFLGVKPQYYDDILKNLDTSNVITLASIMAGVKINTLKNKIQNTSVSVARIMPNTPISIGEGLSAVCFSNVNDEHKSYITSILKACGRVLEIEESKFDAVTSISGSGPAYVYLFLNGMVKGGINGGLTAEESKLLAASTLIGASKLSLDSDLSYDELVNKVCSKGGTTIEAINLFKSNSLEEIIESGIDACRKKSIKLSESN